MVSTHTTAVLLGLTAAASLFLVSNALPVVLPPYPYDAISYTPPPSTGSSQQQAYGHFYAQGRPAEHSSTVDNNNNNNNNNNNVHSKNQQIPQQPHPYLHGANINSKAEDTVPEQKAPTRPSSPSPSLSQQQQQQQHPQQGGRHALLSSSSPSPSLSSRHPLSRSSPSSTSLSSSTPPHAPFSSSSGNTPVSHTHDLRMQTFKSQGPISPKDQILHQCTTHFVALLDTEISDRLLVQLSRLAMMLPVVGVETRAVIRTKVAEVMQQVVRGLTSYEAVEKVIRTAVDDAGLQLVTMAPSTSPLSSELNPSRDNYNDNNDNKSNSLRREAREDDLFVMNNDFRDDVISEYDGEFDESSSISGETNPVTATITADTIDESQIPVVTDIAMEAVLDYMAEILTPSLVIHQLTEAIQGALQDISQQRKAVLRMRVQHKNNKDEKYLDDLDNEEDVVDLDELSSLAFGRSHGNQDRHGIDLLSDGWVWSGPSSSSSHRDSNNLEGGLTEDGSDGQDGEDEDDSRGSDEDLWDKDMETYPWDSTGRLFDDFEDEDVSSSTPQSALSAASVTEQDMANWDMANALAGDDEEGYDDENFDPYVIGIRETNEGCTPHGTGSDDDGGEDDEEDEYDPMADTSEDYGREQYLQQSYFNRFQKRSFIAPPRPPTVPSKNVPSTPAVNVQSTTRAIRRLNLTPDPRLENLLTQLIEPLLTTFIEDDFPASCKRVQGELMDGIIWSLDQGELRGGHGRDGLDSDEERMLLLSELEY